MEQPEDVRGEMSLSLDNRQVVGLSIGCLVVIGAIFVLGVVVGKKLSNSGVDANSPDLLAALDRKASEPKSAPLTFQDELTVKTEPKPEPASSPSPTPVQAQATPAPTSARTSPQPSSFDIKSALTRAQRKILEPASKGSFTLQLSSSPNRSDAEKVAARLKDKGYSPYVVASDVPGKGTWYRVRMGRFSNKDAASNYLHSFHRDTKLQAFVTVSQ